MVGQRCDRRGHAGGLRDSSFSGLRRPCGAAAAGGHLRLFARWARLRAAGFLTPTGDWTDLCDFLDDRGTVAAMADGDAQRYAQIASLAAGMVALLCLIAWLLRLSMLVRLISDSILVGFKAGAGLTIA